MTGVLNAGTNSQLYQLAKKELSPYRGNIIIESITCWVHLDVGSIEYHHIVPRTYGGDNGPQVALCGNCHTGIHNLSYKSMLFDGSITELEAQLNLMEKLAESWISQRVLETNKRNLVLIRAWALAEVIYRSRKLATSAENSENKRIKFNTEFLGHESKMLKVLSRHFGVTQDQFVHLALQDMYSRYIGEL